MFFAYSSIKEGINILYDILIILYRITCLKNTEVIFIIVDLRDRLLVDVGKYMLSTCDKLNTRAVRKQSFNAVGAC